jgi:hypothetical protein
MFTEICDDREWKIPKHEYQVQKEHPSLLMTGGSMIVRQKVRIRQAGGAWYNGSISSSISHGWKVKTWLKLPTIANQSGPESLIDIKVSQKFHTWCLAPSRYHVSSPHSVQYSK